MAQMAGRARYSVQDDSIYQHCAANSGSKGGQNCISTSAGHSPEHFADQRCPPIVIGVNRQIRSRNFLE